VGRFLAKSLCLTDLFRFTVLLQFESATVKNQTDTPADPPILGDGIRRRIMSRAKSCIPRKRLFGCGPFFSKESLLDRLVSIHSVAGVFNNGLQAV
jgi:hypothetical protein